MAQKTWVTGETIVAADVNTYLTGEGGAWTTWTPTLTQSATVAATVTHAVYGRWGRLIVANFRLSVTGTGTAANSVTVSLPVTAARTEMVMGVGFVFDASAGLGYSGSTYTPSTTTLDFRLHGSGTAPANALGVAGFTAALAAGDIVGGQIMYEAAS